MFVAFEWTQKYFQNTNILSSKVTIPTYSVLWRYCENEYKDYSTPYASNKRFKRILTVNLMVDTSSFEIDSVITQVYGNIEPMQRTIFQKWNLKTRKLNKNVWR